MESHFLNKSTWLRKSGIIAFSHLSVVNTEMLMIRRVTKLVLRQLGGALLPRLSSRQSEDRDGLIMTYRNILSGEYFY